MRDFYDPQEYAALELAVQRMETPTPCQVSMALFPPLYIIACNTIIIYIANLYKNTTDPTAPIITTSLSATILIVELVTIAFRHHPRYVTVREYMKLILCITMIQVIVSGCLISVLNKQIYSCITILSLLSILFLMIPFCTTIYS